MADQRTRDAIAADYQAARDRGDAAAMRRYQNEEACLVLLAILERLAADEASFVHGIAVKGGILMAGELHSARSSADIDATTGRGRRVDPDQVVEDLRRAGRGFGLRLESEPDRTLGGLIVRFRFNSLTDAGTAKLEVSVREDLVFAVVAFGGALPTAALIGTLRRRFAILAMRTPSSDAPLDAARPEQWATLQEQGEGIGVNPAALWFAGSPALEVAPGTEVTWHDRVRTQLDLNNVLAIVSPRPAGPSASPEG